MTGSELKQWLPKQGRTFEQGSRHEKVILGDKSTFMPRHPSKELKANTLRAIV